MVFLSLKPFKTFPLLYDKVRLFVKVREALGGLVPAYVYVYPRTRACTHHTLYLTAMLAFPPKRHHACSHMAFPVPAPSPYPAAPGWPTPVYSCSFFWAQFIYHPVRAQLHDTHRHKTRVGGGDGDPPAGSPQHLIYACHVKYS